MPAGRTFFFFYYLTFISRRPSSRNNSNFGFGVGVVHSFTAPTYYCAIHPPPQQLSLLHHHHVIDSSFDRRRIILQVSSVDTMMEPGSSSGNNGVGFGSNAPEYELQTFQLTPEELRQQQQHFHYVAPCDDEDGYATTDSQLLHHQQQQAVASASHDDDVHWSIRSNIFFVTGGLIYLIATSWDWNIYSLPPEQVEDLHNVLNMPQYVFYQLLWIMGPFVYLLNSFIDVKWALLQRARDAQEKEREVRRSHLEAILNTSPPHHHTTNKRRLRINAVLQRPKNLLRRMRKHIGHRRQLGAATTFGIAAAFSVIAALLGLFVTDGSESISQDSKDMIAIWVGWLESASIHMYLVSAMLALWRSPWKSGADSSSSSTAPSASSATMEPIYMGHLIPWYSRTESLETLGDIFFGVAAMVDVFLCDSTLDDGIYWWPVVSAVLWFMDALFYLRGDFATLYKE